ncbi:MAG: hypothetical protein NVS3B20_12930 [Polyangiales bacterium]
MPGSLDRLAHIKSVLAWGPFLALLSFSGCGAAPPRVDFDVLRVPDERAATTWIAKAFRKEGFQLEAERPVKIGGGAVINVDVAAKGDVWGVVWLRADEQAELKGKLPPPPEP